MSSGRACRQQVVLDPCNNERQHERCIQYLANNSQQAPNRSALDHVCHGL